MILRFLGIEAEVYGKGLSKFGQSIELPEDQANAAIASNAPLLPETEFLACGFTPEELDRYAYPGARQQPDPNAPAQKQSEWKAFEQKWRAARIALHDYRERIRSGADARPQDEPQDTKTNLAAVIPLPAEKEAQ